MAKYDHSPYLHLPEHCQTPGRRIMLHLSKSIVPGYSNFSLGTCQGALRAGPTLYELLAVTNSSPGNGDFKRLMRHLLALGRAHKRDLIVLEIKQEYLYQHLQRVYAMQPVPGTLHLLRQVGGPGSCPETFLKSEPHPLLDALLDLATRELANR